MTGTSAGPGVSSETVIVGLVGCGVTGLRIAQYLLRAGLRVVVADADPSVARTLARRFDRVAVIDVADMHAADLVVLAHPQPHLTEVQNLMAGGTPVVSTSDAIPDLAKLLELHHRAEALGVAVVVGAALSPGLSGLLARSLGHQLFRLDELHVAMHGTGGPACARQHHDALGSKAVGWHDGEWIERAGGSGRELCWFPEPVGPQDCYRAALGDPLLLHRSFPGACRVSARVSGTRRDRLTARLPMLLPPHREGDLGAVRVEARGADRRGARITLINGAVGHTADLAAAVVAATVSAMIDDLVPPGVHSLGDSALAPAELLHRVVQLGVRIQEYTGVARPADDAADDAADDDAAAAAGANDADDEATDESVESVLDRFDVGQRSDMARREHDTTMENT